MVEHRLQVGPRLPALATEPPLAGVGVGKRDDPAEVAPAAIVAHEQREVPARPRTSISAPWIARIPQSGAI